ncbi:Ribosomal protein L7Ae/L30e/S12e/Gadd45 family protein [Babesia bovis T2Bo]|uniref:Ribosomal protein L7Ae-related protein, putative n=1 Tax=Babesia bovis TaxID=5865 RepID=A7ATW9_BABBO|nr:Ribosomal protein L7Ae/L30e/S12e/Gadd45 family protein [Babesia bovis T2Bo]EDO06380.1 Ribosomal protein L7Ae/L30e/S12e/Gadd45 family protein [Babesia bovis T2Bo]|eukprot:XP_001609948.1 ribosomal protein L7Ae-related protein [Babesia bovis T2Bo]
MEDVDANMEFGEEGSTYISPIANPQLSGRMLKRAMKLLKKALSVEKLAKQHQMEKGNNDIVMTRLVKRGVQDVTKAIRKGMDGIVFIACDVHPIDVVSHLPVMCEEANMAYAYVDSKRVISSVCQSKRPTCVVLIVKPPHDLDKRLQTLVQDKHDRLSYLELYDKLNSAIRDLHPFL